jgi:hypothetical protein
VGTAAASGYMGLLVRLPIGAFLLWLAALSAFAVRQAWGVGHRPIRQAR